MARLPQRLPSFVIGQRGIPDEIWLEDNEKIYFGDDKGVCLYATSTGFWIDVLNKTSRSLNLINRSGTGTIVLWNTILANEINAQSNYLTLKGYGTYPVRIGTGTSSRGLASNDDLFVSGKLEVDGEVYFDNTLNVINISNTGGYYVGGMSWSWGGMVTARALSSTDKSLGFGIGTDSNICIFAKGSNVTLNHSLTAETNPTIYIFSATDPTTDNTQYIKFQHDQTDGIIAVGKGSVKIDSGMKVKRTATTTDYTTTESDYIVAVTDTTAARTITLASATCTEGKVVIIKDESGGAGTNNITIATEGSETIDGAASTTISTNYGVIRLYSDGSDWFTW